MPIKSDRERLVIVEDRLDRLDNYMSSGEDFRNDTTAKLSRLLAITEGFIKYQETCDQERKSIKDRTESLERNQSKQSGMAIGASTVISLIAGVIGFMWGHK